ncbi:chromosome partitioning protein ParA [Corynebacterium bovis]|uniref:ParA family protein n=1 Tax=Corynebacterium bovis TaxID=36808 RepID=UPI000F649B56|nr:ParA family protein [Corynebacterium bovis]RRO97063.1 chromosome partitioning protein ParA [Corynebacterium bovis]
MRIAIVNTKGGVGKTTSSIYLATAAAREGIPATIFDADTQGSASEWAGTAIADGLDLPWNVTSVTQYHLSTMGDTPSTDSLEIIDCPPKDPQIVNEAIRAADFVIIPTQPTGIDMSRVWKTLEHIGDTPAAVLLTAVRLNTNLLRDAQAALDEQHVPYFETVIAQREAIRAAMSTVPTRLFGYDDVLHEIQEALQ